MLTRRCRFSSFANVLALHKITSILPNSPFYQAPSLQSLLPFFDIAMSLNSLAWTLHPTSLQRSTLFHVTFNLFFYNFYNTSVSFSISFNMEATPLIQRCFIPLYIKELRIGSGINCPEKTSMVWQGGGQEDSNTCKCSDPPNIYLFLHFQVIIFKIVQNCEFYAKN